MKRSIKSLTLVAVFIAAALSQQACAMDAKIATVRSALGPTATIAARTVPYGIGIIAGGWLALQNMQSLGPTVEIYRKQGKKHALWAAFKDKPVQYSAALAISLGIMGYCGFKLINNAIRG